MGDLESAKTVLSPRELAEAIGVSESSIKRWVDDGLIAASRTAGGHRRIEASEALRFVRASGSIVVKPELLGLGELTLLQDQLPSDDEEAEALFRFLARGAAQESRGLLVSLFVRGRSVAHIVDGPLRIAMERIGELWRHEQPGVYYEHRATGIAIQAIDRLRMLLRVPAGAPRAVGGAVSGDPYILPTLCVAAVLESQGVAAVNLGPETPLSTLRLAVDDLDARLAWLTVSVAGNPTGLSREADRLLEALRVRNTPLVLGGAQARRLRLRGDDLLYVGSSMAELEALLRGLRLGAEGNMALPIA